MTIILLKALVTAIICTGVMALIVHKKHRGNFLRGAAAAVMILVGTIAVAAAVDFVWSFV